MKRKVKLKLVILCIVSFFFLMGSDCNCDGIDDPEEEAPSVETQINGKFGSVDTVSVGSTVKIIAVISAGTPHPKVSWEMVQKPSSSLSELSTNIATSVEFIPDKEGIYRIRYDAANTVDSQIDTVTVVAISKPIATAGVDLTANTGETIQLDGSGSSGNQLIYQWSFNSRPTGSASQLNNPDQVFSNFLMDEPGEYMVELNVMDVKALEDNDTVKVSSNPATITSFAPTGGMAGTEVTISGSNFSKNASFMAVQFGSEPAQINLLDYTEIKAVVPALNPGDYTINVIIHGDTVSSGSLFTVPGQNPWTSLTDFPGPGRSEAIGVSLNGFGYAGLGSDGNNPLIDFWKFDPAGNSGDGSWEQKANYPGEGKVNSVAFALNNKIYVGLGKTHILVAPASKKFFEYDPPSNTWNSIPDFPGEARQGAVAFVINGKAYVGLGKASGQPAYYSDFYEYDPVLNQWYTTKIDFPAGERADAIAFTLNGKGYVGYGESQSPTGPVIDFWEFTPPSSWVSKVAINNSFVHSIGVSSGGNGYLIGGNTIAPTNENGKRVWMYNSASQQWTQKTSAPNFLVRAIGFEINGRIYCGLNTLMTEFYLYNPSLDL